jgi:apolipoprotein N-acyltransferase
VAKPETGERSVAYAPRMAVLVAGALPVLAFPGAGLDWLAWVLLIPGLLTVKASPGAREAAVRGWWFGAGYLLAALYWTVPNIGPGLVLVAGGFGAPWAAWGWAAWALRPYAAVLVVPALWVLIEYARSWHALGGPWALFGASQWRHPVVLSLAALGGVWLVGFVLVGVNVALAFAVAERRAGLVTVAVGLGLTAPLAYAVRAEPSVREERRVALVQPGVVHGPAPRFDAGERITQELPPVDLIVWGESSVGFDLARRPDLTARLTALAARADLMVNEDARDADGRISKSSLVVTASGVRGRYVKTRLVPFGEYIPFRPLFGWLARISEAAGEDRVPGTGAGVLTAGGLPVGPLVCFESAFPDLGRAVASDGARLVVIQSATSTFQQSWAPPQHASLAAVRAAETGRPVVQAALTGVSAGFDARGRRLAWLDTSRRGSAVVSLGLPDPADVTPFVRYGGHVPVVGMLLVLVGLLWRPVGSGPLSLPSGTRRFLP